MEHLRTDTDELVGAYGLTRGQFQTVIELQNMMGGSHAAFDAAYELLTRNMMLGSPSDEKMLIGKVKGYDRFGRATIKSYRQLNEKQLSKVYSYGDRLNEQGEYVRLRYFMSE